MAPRDSIISALNDGKNEHRKDIIKVILELIPARRRVEYFNFICMGIERTKVSVATARSILKLILSKNDVETVNDGDDVKTPADITDLRFVGEIPVALNLTYLFKKYNSIFENIFSMVTDEVIDTYGENPKFIKIIIMGFIKLDGATQKQIYNKCVEDGFIADENAKPSEDQPEQNNPAEEKDTAISTDKESSGEIVQGNVKVTSEA